MVLEKNEYGKWMKCPKGHPQPELVTKSDNLTSKNIYPMRKIEVQSDENLLAVHNHNCPKCGYDKAELIEKSASYSDEDNTYRMKCGKCKYVVKLEGKTK